MMDLKNRINSTKSVLFRSGRMIKLMLAFSGFFIFVTGCNKYELNPEQEECIGDFEWGYTTNSSFESTSQDNYSDRYGIRIKENSKVYVFKNDDIIYKGKIDDIFTMASGKYSIKVFDKSGYIVDDGYINIQYDKGLLISTNWPLANSDNYYFKK